MSTQRKAEGHKNGPHTKRLSTKSLLDKSLLTKRFLLYITSPVIKHLRNKTSPVTKKMYRLKCKFCKEYFYHTAVNNGKETYCDGNVLCVDVLHGDV
jgi:hypothetical protein